MYEVVWVRSLSLVFGGSHLAVTTVLSVFMAGLAAGGYLVGRYVDRTERPLRLYGLLELGIALSALLFFGLMKIYPFIYVHLVHGRDEDHSFLYLSLIKVFFASIALILPTIFMGGTLPVLSRFVSKHQKAFMANLSFLYGFNTLGAVIGTLAAGFLFLPSFSVSTTFFIAVITNASIGVASILLERKSEYRFEFSEKAEKRPKEVPVRPFPEREAFPYKLVLWGIGVSGFCALGYEVLWTRVVTIVVGATVYGFTTMLAAFLTGIALGSKALGLFKRIFPRRLAGLDSLVLSFGIVQLAIGILALLVTVKLRDLPANSMAIDRFFLSLGIELFAARQWANVGVSFLYMVVPAFFMGAAFPIAGAVQTEYRKKIGRAVGEVLAFNTIGAIFGAALSGFLLIHVFGTERSLQIFTLINVSLGIFVLLSLKRSRLLLGAAAGLATAVIIVLAVSPGHFRIWDPQYFAIFQANRPESFSTPGQVKEALETTEVLYFHEGAESTVSSVRRAWGEQSFIINGRVEASTIPGDKQLQYTLGHLPMLLAKDPRKVLVIGLGSGMTLGAATVHPAAEKVTLVELEPEMTGVARTFAAYNHNVLDDPKLEIVINDGRNYLLTTDGKFDVITADPVHPWFRGAGYLYTKEYFKLAASRLSEGGVICQWLPIYELSIKDLKSVVKTFGESFKHTLLWVTHWDSVIIGANAPIVLDQAELERRISVPAVKADLESVFMGTARDFLSYFAMGTRNMRQFGEDGIINTDDNLYLEFSAPMSMGISLTGTNAATFARYRESIVPYLNLWNHGPPGEDRITEWIELDKAGRSYDRAHALLLAEKLEDPELPASMILLGKNYPDYAPGRFLRGVYSHEIYKLPRPVDSLELVCIDGKGKRTEIDLIALKTKMGPGAAFLDFADERRKVLFGKARFFKGKAVDKQIGYFVSGVMAEIKQAYMNEAALTSPASFESESAPSLEKMDEIIKSKLNH